MGPECLLAGVPGYPSDGSNPDQWPGPCTCVKGAFTVCIYNISYGFMLVLKSDWPAVTDCQELNWNRS